MSKKKVGEIDGQGRKRGRIGVKAKGERIFRKKKKIITQREVKEKMHK